MAIGMHVKVHEHDYSYTNQIYKSTAHYNKVNCKKFNDSMDDKNLQ